MTGCSQYMKSTISGKIIDLDLYEIEWVKNNHAESSYRGQHVVIGYSHFLVFRKDRAECGVKDWTNIFLAIQKTSHIVLLTKVDSPVLEKLRGAVDSKKIEGGLLFVIMDSRNILHSIKEIGIIVDAYDVGDRTYNSVGMHLLQENEVVINLRETFSNLNQNLIEFRVNDRPYINRFNRLNTRLRVDLDKLLSLYEFKTIDQEHELLPFELSFDTRTRNTLVALRDIGQGDFLQEPIQRSTSEEEARIKSTEIYKEFAEKLKL